MKGGGLQIVERLDALEDALAADRGAGCGWGERAEDVGDLRAKEVDSATTNDQDQKNPGKHWRTNCGTG